MKKSAKGYSLIEMLVAISVLGFVAVAGSNLFFGTLFGSSKSEIIKEVKQNGEYALFTLEGMIKNSLSVIDCSSNSLTIKGQDGQETLFRLLSDVNGISRIASNSSYLTGAKAKVSAFAIECTDLQPGRPVKVSISYTIENYLGNQEAADVRPEKKGSLSFSTVVSSRNSYQEKLD